MLNFFFLGKFQLKLQNFSCLLENQQLDMEILICVCSGSSFSIGTIDFFDK